MEWNPKSKYSTLVSRIQDLLDDGRDRTTRDIYYALESRGHDYDYSDVMRAVKKGRRAGYIDPSQIVDTSRSAETLNHSRYDTPEHFLDSAVEGIWDRYDVDPWRDQQHYVEVWLEKASLSSVFSPICEDWNVRLEATRGDWSDSKIYRATQRLIDQLEEGDDVRVLYFGDFNPSGFHAPVAVQATMSHYGVDFRDKVKSSDSRYFNIWVPDGPIEFNGLDGTLMFERIAMNPEHIERYNLPENPTPSSTDKDQTIRDNFLNAVTGGQDVNVELNALKEFHRDDFEDMIEEAIVEYVDQQAWDSTRDRVDSARDDLSDAISIHRDRV